MSYETCHIPHVILDGTKDVISCGDARPVSCFTYIDPHIRYLLVDDFRLGTVGHLLLFVVDEECQRDEYKSQSLLGSVHQLYPDTGGDMIVAYFLSYENYVPYLSTC